MEDATLPTGLIIVTAIDLIVDGLVLGIAFSAGEQTGLILTIALTLEVLFLALSVSAALNVARTSRLWTLAVPVVLAALLSISAVGGHALFAGSLRAGQRAAAIMSLIRSAQLNGHDPYAYLKEVLTDCPRIVPTTSRRCFRIAGRSPRLDQRHLTSLGAFTGCLPMLSTIA